jgi:hypothetical protein
VLKREKRSSTYQPKINPMVMVRYMLLPVTILIQMISLPSLLAVFLVMMNGYLILPFHICCNKDLFSTYEFVQSGNVVRMGDKNPSEIVGTGLVQIRMHDGMVHMLTVVRKVIIRYGPSLRRWVFVLLC